MLKSSMKERFAQRNEAYARKGNKGKSFSGLSLSGLSTPPDFFSPKAGERYRITILPYKITEKNPTVQLHAKNPPQKGNRLVAGEYDWLLDFFIHRNIGPDKQTVVCPKSTFGKPCPICEARAKLYQEGQEAVARQLSASRRALYNVLVDNDYQSEEAKFMLFNTSHALFEQVMMKEYQISQGDGEDIDFTDSATGNKVLFNATEGNGGGFKFVQFEHFRFPKRKSPAKFNEASVICLDNLLIINTYDELKAILNGSEEQREDDEYTPQTQPQVAARPVTGTCPSGHLFGEYLRHDECFGCEKEDTCKFVSPSDNEGNGIPY